MQLLITIVCLFVSLSVFDITYHKKIRPIHLNLDPQIKLIFILAPPPSPPFHPTAFKFIVTTRLYLFFVFVSLLQSVW